MPEHGGGVLGPRTVVEGQHDFAGAQEIVLLEMLEAEARPAGRVDLDDARKAHAARLVADADIGGRGGGAGVVGRGRRASVGRAVFSASALRRGGSRRRRRCRHDRRRRERRRRRWTVVEASASVSRTGEATGVGGAALA